MKVDIPEYTGVRLGPEHTFESSSPFDTHMLAHRERKRYIFFMLNIREPRHCFVIDGIAADGMD
jgi:hypothetical protein